MVYQILLVVLGVFGVAFVEVAQHLESVVALYALASCIDYGRTAEGILKSRYKFWT